MRAGVSEEADRARHGDSAITAGWPPVVMLRLHIATSALAVAAIDDL